VVDKLPGVKDGFAYLCKASHAPSGLQS
jgi:hypothetical protein